MDRYLFRGLRTNGEGWVYGMLLYNAWGSYIVTHYSIHGEKPVMSIYHQVIPETVGQWTGLRDKWKQMIFEGDIVLSEIDETSGTVGYSIDIVGFQLHAVDNDDYAMYKSFDYEVIGNIHEEASNEART